MTAPSEPGLYPDISDHVYHADIRSLSSSGARMLVTRTPFEFDYARRHPPAPKKAYDFGHAAHRYLLGKGSEIEVLHYDSYNTKAAREERDAAYDEGKVPLLVDVDIAARELAAQARRHELVAVLLTAGVAEVSGWWIDQRTGIWCRVRPDWMTILGDTLYIVDAKTTEDASPPAFAKSVYTYGYHQQDPWYVDGIDALRADAERMLGPFARIVFLIVAVCKKPPYITNVFQLDETAVRIGGRRNEQAREIFARCMDSGDWPGYGLGPHELSLPTWATYREDIEA